jgi:Transposase DDE domain
VDADLDTLATALYVTTDDFLADNPQYRPWRPKVGLKPRLSDAELVTMMVLQALLGFTSEARWLRYANTHLRGMFPDLPTQSGYNKRVRAATGMLRAVFAHLVACTSRSTDDVWVVDSTPVECGRSRETAKRSDLAGWAEYGYCASHSRYFWGLRLHLLCTPAGLPVAFALTGAKTDERDTLLGMLDADPALLAARLNQQLMADKNYYGKQFETELASKGITLLRPARKGEKPRAGQRFFKPLRQIIESINNTLKAHLDLERHGGRTIAGVAARVLQRVLALTTAIWHNDHSSQPVLRSLTAYDH